MNFRRRFLAQLGSLVLSPFAWRPGSVRAATPWLSYRPGVFEVTTDSAVVWVCCAADTTVRVRYQPVDGSAATTVTAALALTKASDHTGAIALNGLRPDSRYRFHITGAAGTPRDAGFAGGTFRTAPDSDRDFAFVFSGDTHARHRPFTLFDRMAEKNPDFFIHLGDTVYADSPRSQFRPALDYYRFKHRELRRDTHLQQFLAAVPTFAIWDDHEVENDFTGSHPALAQGRQAFREFWPIANRSADDTILYRRFSWTPDCEFFILDTRQYRDQGEYDERSAKTMLGARQLAWLKAGLKASRAQFKFICSSVPFHHNAIDKWGGFKAERRELTEFIRNAGIRNVVILSADLHAAADLSDERTGLAEFLVGPIAAPLQEPALAAKSSLREKSRPGSYVGDAYNFGLIRVSHRDGRAVLRHQVIDVNDEVRYTREIVAGA